MANKDEAKKSKVPAKKSTTSKKVTTKKTAPAKTVKSASKKTTSGKTSVTKKVTTKKSTATKTTTVKKVATKKPVEKKASTKTTVKKNTAPKKTVVSKPVEKVPAVAPIVKPEIKEEVLEAENINLIKTIIVVIVVLMVCGGVYIYKYSTNEKDKDSATQEFNTGKYKDQKQMKDEDEIKQDNSGKTDVIEDYSNLVSISIYDLSEKMDTSEEMIIYIASKTCGVCTIFEPVLNNALVDLEMKAYKIDIADFKTSDERKLFNEIFDIDGTPVLSIIKNGSIKATVSGSRDREGVKTWINENY